MQNLNPNTSKDCDSIECQCLRAHNQYRQMHNSPPLITNEKLNIIASDWATKLANRDELEHNPACDYGENLYFCSGISKVTGDMAVKPWYDEIRKYDFEKADYVPGAAHFTQVVWKETKELGTGYALKGNKFYLVCNYFPPGNVLGKFKDNVLPKNNTA